MCLRKYRGLKSSGFGVVEKAVSYQAFRLTVKFKHVTDAPETNFVENNNGMFLVVIAVPVYTSYKSKSMCFVRKNLEKLSDLGGAQAINFLLQIHLLGKFSLG